MLKISAMRYNPADPASVPHIQTYEIEQSDGMTLFMALMEIRERLDPSLQFDFVCRAGICGSCAMVVNGRPTLACRTLTRDIGPDITLAPLPFFELIGDLSVNTGKWMRALSEKLEAWCHTKQQEVDLTRSRSGWSRNSRRRSSSSTAASSAAAASPAAARRACARTSSARSASTRSRASVSTRATCGPTTDYYEVIGDDNGVFGCMSLLGCHDVCPKELPLQTQIAFIRRKMVREGMS